MPSGDSGHRQLEDLRLKNKRRLSFLEVENGRLKDKLERIHSLLTAYYAPDPERSGCQDVRMIHAMEDEIFNIPNFLETHTASVSEASQ